MVHTETVTGVVGTPTPLAPSRIPAGWVLIQSRQANTGAVIVRDGGPTNTGPGATGGVTLTSPGASVLFAWMGAPNCYDLEEIFITIAQAGDGVDVTYGK